MRHFLVSTALLFSLVSPTHAAPGFVEESLWLSKEPVFAGQSVRIFTVVANPTNDALDGTVVFFDADTELGRRGVSLSAGASELVSVAWTPGEGGHEIFAQFESADGTIVGQATSAKLARHIVPDTDGDGVGDDVDEDDDNDGISDVDDDEPLVAKKEKEETTDDNEESVQKKVTDAVKPVVEEQAPKVVAAAHAAADAVENFRTAQGERLTGMRERIQAETEAKDTQGEETGESGSSFADTLQLAAVGTAAFVFNNMLLFYLVALAGLYFGVRKGVNLIRRKTGADRLAD